MCERNRTMCRAAANETDSTESLTDTTGVAKVTFGNDVPANLLGSIVLVDTPALDGQLKTAAGNPLCLRWRREPATWSARTDGFEVIRIHIASASLTGCLRPGR